MFLFFHLQNINKNTKKIAFDGKEMKKLYTIIHMNMQVNIIKYVHI